VALCARTPRPIRSLRKEPDGREQSDAGEGDLHESFHAVFLYVVLSL